MISRTILM